ncbi:MAG: hypothetical protein AAGF24_05320 [Cyanobacteria bacterium P01_H01_bin.121]
MQQVQMPIHPNVRAVVDGVEYDVGRDYSLELTYTRAGGWRLWQHIPESDREPGESSPRLIGGEFDNTAFTVQAQGLIVCQNERAAGDV